MNINCKVKKGACTIKTKAAAITIDSEIKVNDLVLPGPGEYEIAESFLEVGDDFIYIHGDSVTLAYFGPTRDEVSEAELEMLETADAVLFKLEDQDKERLAKISKMIKMIDPRMVFLVGLENPDVFKGVEGQSPEPVETFKLTRSVLPEEDRLIYSLATK